MLRVVIADDEIKICKLLQVLVDWGSLGFEIVDIEHDGRSLLRAVEETKPDVVITDIRMPGYTGLELLHSIRERQLDIDIIIMSGYRQFEYVRQALQDGAVDYLPKPLDRSAVREALRKVSARRAAVHEDRERVEHMQAASERLSRKLHEDLVYKIIGEQLKEGSIADLNQDYGCDFQKSKLYFAAFKIDSMDLPMEHIGQRIRGYLREGMEKKGYRCFSGDRANVVFLLLNADSMDELSQSLYQMSYELRDHYAEVSSSHVSVGVAAVERNQLTEAAYRSFCAAQDQLFRGVDKVLPYRAVSLRREAPLFDKRGEEQLRAVLERGAHGYLLMLIGQYLDKIHARGDASQSGALVYRDICELQQRLMNACGLLYENDEQITALLEKYRLLLHCCFSWDSYRQLLNEEVNKLMSEVEVWQSSKEKKPVRQLRRIIAERYREELSLEQLADEMGLSPAYISKLFKKELDVTFTQYLNHVRLEQAKKLLSGTNDTIAQIADAVGYQDEKYFMRLFKKETGLTTTEYRQLYGE